MLSPKADTPFCNVAAYLVQRSDENKLNKYRIDKVSIHEKNKLDETRSHPPVDGVSLSGSANKPTTTKFEKFLRLEANGSWQQIRGK